MGPPKDAFYLGYGVHASYDAVEPQIFLWVSRENGYHYIAITAEELIALNEYAKTRGWKL